MARRLLYDVRDLLFRLLDAALAMLLGGLILTWTEQQIIDRVG